MDLCSVQNTQSPSANAQYDIIKNGCLSELVYAKVYSESLISYSSTDDIQIGYKSFSFDQNNDHSGYQLSCKVKFCVGPDEADCGPTECPEGYYLPESNNE